MTFRSALLWMTHVWDPEIEKEFEQFLHIDYPGSPDVWLILDAKTPVAKNIARRFKRCHIFMVKEMFQRLPYRHTSSSRSCNSPLEEETLYSQVHFPILDFYLSHQEYDHYWVIEFDVRYTGKWGSLLNLFGSFDHDLITCHIRHASEEPDWFGWDTFNHPTKTIDRAKYMRCFMVVYRISNRALFLIHNAQQDGWRGHPEVLIPTLLYNRGYSLLDFGGDGDFTPPGLRNKTYTSHGLKNGLLNPFCTMCWRPSRDKAGLRRNKLYHPIKPKWMMESIKEKLKYLYTWTREFIRYNILMQT